MLSDKFVLEELNKLPLEQQVKCLLEALKIQKEHPHRSNTACVAIALNIPTFPKVSRIISKDGYQLTLLFTNGEARRVDFRQFFQPERRYDKIMLGHPEKFDQVEVEDGTLVWREVGYWSKNLDGESQFMYYDIDPALLYETGRAVARVNS